VLPKALGLRRVEIVMSIREISCNNEVPERLLLEGDLVGHNNKRIRSSEW
jgi:hypothetical protein